VQEGTVLGEEGQAEMWLCPGLSAADLTVATGSTSTDPNPVVFPSTALAVTPLRKPPVLF